LSKVVYQISHWYWHISYRLLVIGLPAEFHIANGADVCGQCMLPSVAQYVHTILVRHVLQGTPSKVLASTCGPVEVYMCEASSLIILVMLGG